MKKAVISIFIVLTLVLNIFGFGVLGSRAAAVVAIDDVILGIILTGIGALASGVAFSMAQAETEYISANWDTWMSNRVQNNAFTSGEFITLDLFDNHFEPVSGLSDYDLEMATFVCDYLNNNSNLDVVISGYRAEYGDVGIQNGEIKADLYCTLKTAAINAFEAYINVMRQVKDEISEYNSALDAIEAALGEDWEPSYEFSFEDDTPVNISDVNSICDVTIEGVHFFPPILLTYTDADGWPTRDTIEALGGTVKWPMGNGYYGTKPVRPGYGGSCYLIYDNDIYFNNHYSHRRDGVDQDDISIVIPGSNNLHSWKNVQNEALSSKVNSINDILGSYFGVYAWTGPGNLEDRPIINNLPQNNDFINTSEGGSVTITRSNDENTIGLAQEYGIISENPTIELNPDGSISSVDGISLATLENLLRELIDKTYNFSSFEEYLQTITQLLTAANVNTDQISDVLNALRAWEANQEDALDNINSSINAAASSITDALEISGEGELDLPDIDADGFLVTHTGLAEATTIVNSIPIVNQVSQLINNLLDSSQYDNSPPNFRFYMDSDGDGVSELYNGFDLSFLETDLSNNTLQDSERFQSSMTIRQFLQYLIIFICYLAFAIRIIKKLPSLFGSSESSNEFNSDVK